MLTYNQIIKISRAFQQAHYQLKNFGNGSNEADMVLHNQQATYKYPLIWMIDSNSPFQDGMESYAFKVLFLAPVVTLKERESDLMSTNVNEVKSDMMQCAKDFIAYWVQQTDDYDTLGFDKSVNRETLEDYTDDKLAGCSIDIRFYQPMDYDECSIPMGTPTSLPDTCAPVLIYEDGILVDTVASGGTYSYTSSSGEIDVYVNGVLFYNDVSTDQNLPVINNDSDPVGTKVGSNFVIGNTNAQIENTIGDVLLTATLDAETNGTFVVGGVTTILNGTALVEPPAETTKTLTIEYANGDPVVVTTVTDTATVFDGTIPDVVVPINVATTFKDGQTTSYLTGDAGDLEIGAGSSFTVLDSANLFGNTDRFTDELGGQTYTKNYICDWSCYNQVTGRVRVWYRTPTSAVISTALAGQPYTLSSISGWYIPNIKQLFDWLRFEAAATMSNFAPFNINANSLANSLMVTNTASSTVTYRFANSPILIVVAPSNTCRYILFRDCTLAELAAL